jgi:hypothetical protein
MPQLLTPIDKEFSMGRQVTLFMRTSGFQGMTAVANDNMQLYCEDGNCPAAADCVRYWSRRIAVGTKIEGRPGKIKLIKYPRDPALGHCIAYVSRKAREDLESADVWCATAFQG